MMIERALPAAVATEGGEVVIRMTAEAAADLALALSKSRVDVWAPVIVELRAAKAELVDQVDVGRVTSFSWAPCPAQCGRRIRTGHIMCPACWTRVPEDLRHKTWAALHEWRAAEPADQALKEAAFEAARDEAVDAALGELLPVREEPPC